MNEQKKLYVVLAAIVSFLVLVFVINFINENNSKKYLETFNTILESGEKKIILLGKDSCPYCQMFQPLLDYMKEEYKFDYLYIDTQKITSKALGEVIDKLNIDPDDFGTPHLSLVNGGKVVAEIAGYVSEETLLNFLIKHDYAPKDAKVPLNYLSYEEYENLIASDKLEVLVIGQTSCSACMMAKPALLTLTTEYGIKINYLNLTDIKAAENGTELIEKFNSSLDFYKQEEWGTPLMIVVKDKKVLGSSKGYHSLEDYVSFLKKQGFIGE
ncbi:MAG: thioredoxin family protein [Firmicutes bacterium]|nr:thioredoxin family protein [Bacillota bacterium]